MTPQPHAQPLLPRVQAVLLVVGLRSVICLETGASFVLSVGVREAEAGVVTSYGATGGSSGPVREDDITVYYRRVAGRDCGPQVRDRSNLKECPCPK